MLADRGPDLLVLSVLAVVTAGFVAILAHTAGPDIPSAPLTPPVRARSLSSRAVVEHPTRRAVPAALPAVASKPTVTRLLVTAKRGASWVVVRAASATGKVLYAATLHQGETTQAAAPRLFLRLGDAGQVDVSINGHPLRQALSGTVNVILTPTGLASS
jgi:hypothetical protein